MLIKIKSPEMAEKERKIREQELKKQEKENCIEKDIEKLCRYFNKLIDEAINEGKKIKIDNLYEDDINQYWYFWESYKIVEQIFRNAGYKVYSFRGLNNMKFIKINIEWN